MAKVKEVEEEEEEPVVPTVTQPVQKRSKRLCVSCDAPMDGRFCSRCGIEATAGGSRDTNFAERLAKVETEHAADRAALLPVAKLLDKLRKAGIDPEEVDESHLSMIAGFMKGGGMSGVGAIMGQLFPGAAGLFGKKALPPNDEDVEP